MNEKLRFKTTNVKWLFEIMTNIYRLVISLRNQLNFLDCISWPVNKSNDLKTPTKVPFFSTQIVEPPYERYNCNSLRIYSLTHEQNCIAKRHQRREMCFFSNRNTSSTKGRFNSYSVVLQLLLLTVRIILITPTPSFGWVSGLRRGRERITARQAK